MSASAPPVPISLNRRRAITTGLLLGLMLGALEATVVSTAMPTVIATLGGLAHYSWVFSAYLLTSTASVPIWGRLSDLFGRRRMYLAGIAIFIVGSALSGVATSMVQLIIFRALQGLGAGAVLPLGMTIVGELYSLSERASAQALFSGVWGVSSIIGPLVGGYITDALSWRWVFYLNLPFGLLAAAVIAMAYPPPPHKTDVRVDWLGAGLLFSSVTALLLALSEPPFGVVPWLVATAVLVTWLIRVERRVAVPILPLDLFSSPLVVRALTVAFISGTAMFGAIAYVPLFVQGVQGGTATEAGQVLTPLFLGWVTTSVLAARVTMKVGYRRMVIFGSLLVAGGFVVLALMRPDTTRTVIYAALLVIGSGLGFSVLSLLLALQTGVDRAHLGMATSLNQFARSVGSTVGVAVMGGMLTRGLHGASIGTGHEMAAGLSQLEGAARGAFASALSTVFLTGAIVSLVALVVSFFLPAVDLSQAHMSASDSVMGGELGSFDGDES